MADLYTYVEAKFATIHNRGDRIETVFPDGASTSNWVPQDDDGTFAAVARDCGFTDSFRYLAAHEVVHTIAPQCLFDRPGYVTWMAAHNKTMNLAAARAEERLIFYIQRAACGACPIIDPQWEWIIGALASMGCCGDIEVVRLQ